MSKRGGKVSEKELLPNGPQQVGLLNLHKGKTSEHAWRKISERELPNGPQQFGLLTLRRGKTSEQAQGYGELPARFRPDSPFGSDFLSLRMHARRSHGRDFWLVPVQCVTKRKIARADSPPI